MGTLASCLKANKGLSKEDKASIRAKAKEYRDEGYEGSKANMSAVSDFANEVETDKATIVSQIKEQLPGWKEPARPQLRGTKEAKAKEAAALAAKEAETLREPKVEPEAVEATKSEDSAPKPAPKEGVAPVVEEKAKETKPEKAKEPKVEAEEKPWKPPSAKELFSEEELADKKGRFSKSSQTYDTTPEQVADELRSGWLGKGYDRLIDSGKMAVVANVDDLPAGLDIQGTKGVYLDGKVFLVADQIEGGKTESVFLHEAAHAILGDDQIYSKQKDKILADFEKLGEFGSKKVSAAFDQVPEGTPEEFRTEEALGYFLESNPEHSLFRRFVAAVKSAFRRIGVNVGSLTEADFMTMFKSGAQAWAKQETTAEATDKAGPLFSKQEGPQLATTPESQSIVAKLEKLYGTRGISPAKTKRMIDKYESLVKTLKDDKIDILAKQTALTKHIRAELPIGEHGRVMTAIKDIAKYKTEKGRAANLQRAIHKVEEVHQRLAKKDALASVDKILGKKKPGKLKQGLPKNKGMEPEGRRLIGWAWKYRNDEEAGINRLTELMALEDKSTEAEGMPLTDDEMNEQAIIRMIVGLDGKTTEEIEAVAAELENIISGSGASWKAAETKRKEEWKARRDELVSFITGGKKGSDQYAEKLERQAKGYGTKAKELLNSLEDMHIDFAGLMDKIVSSDKKSKPLENPLAEHYVRQAFDASQDERNANQANVQTLSNAIIDIYGGKKGLERTLTENKRVSENTGVTIRSTELLKVDPDVDPDTGAKGFRVGSSFFDDKASAQAYAMKANRQAAKEGRREIPLSKEVAGTMWMQLQQESILDDLDRQGVDYTTQGELEKFLGPQALKQAKWYLSSYQASREATNEIHKQRYYADMANIAGYSPTKRRHLGETVDDAMLRQESMHASLVPSALKGRVKNARELIFEPMSTVWLRHMTEAEHFKAWAMPMWEMRSVLGSQPVQEALQKNRPTSRKALNRFVDDFARGGVDRGRSIKALDQIRANFAVANVGLKPVVMLKQLTSIPAYAQDIPTAAFAKGVSYAMTHPAQAYAALKDSKELQHRGKGGHERDIALALQRSEVKMMSGKHRLRDLAMAPAMFGDKLAIVLGGYGVYKYHLDRLQKGGMGIEKAKKEALYQFDRATVRSQQSADIMNLGWIQRQGSLGNLFTMFMTSPASYTRNSMLAIRSIAAGRGNQAENMKRLAINWVILNGMFQFVSGGFDWDTEEELSAILAGPLNGLAFIRDASGAMLSALFEGRAYQSVGTPPPLTTAKTAAQSFAKLHKLLVEGYDEKRVNSMLEDWSEIGANMAGVPLIGAKRVIEGIGATLEGGNPLGVLGYTERNIEKK